MTETFYEVLRRQGITRRSFMKFCSLTATSLGLGSAFSERIANALETKPRTPVLWLHGLECTCCSESFIRSAHPLAKDVVLSMLSLDYDDTLMAAAGHQGLHGVGPNFRSSALAQGPSFSRKILALCRMSTGIARMNKKSWMVWVDAQFAPKRLNSSRNRDCAARPRGYCWGQGSTMIAGRCRPGRPNPTRAER